MRLGPPISRDRRHPSVLLLRFRPSDTRAIRTGALNHGPLTSSFPVESTAAARYTPAPSIVPPGLARAWLEISFSLSAVGQTPMLNRVVAITLASWGILFSPAFAAAPGAGRPRPTSTPPCSWPTAPTTCRKITRCWCLVRPRTRPPSQGCLTLSGLLGCSERSTPTRSMLPSCKRSLPSWKRNISRPTPISSSSTANSRPKAQVGQDADRSRLGRLRVAHRGDRAGK